MPLYEYECSACHKRTEKIQKFSDSPLIRCPSCGEAALERTITAPAFQFAGGGWYKDGYGSAKPPAAGGEGKSDSTPAPSADKPSDTSASPQPAAPAPSSTAPAPSPPAKT